MHDDEQRRGCDLRDADEIAQRVVADFAVHRRHDGLRRLRADEQRVAVRRRFRHVFGADDAACAGAVLDEERLSDALGEPLREDARRQIDSAARGERNHDAHGLRRIRLGKDTGGEPGEYKQQTQIPESPRRNAPDPAFSYTRKWV